MNEEMISVIVPIYKVEKYIHRCVDSIINQTYKNIEIILVDDGSPDNCPKICDEYAQKDSRIRVIHKKNGGLSDARNAGIDIARGVYIGFVDSDDYIAESMYEKLLNAIKKNNADVSICNFLYVDENGNDCGNNDNMPIQDEVLSGKDILIDKMFEDKYWHWTVAWNKLYKREIFDKLRYPVGKKHEDEFLLHKICHNRIIVGIFDALYFYVQRDSSIMGQGINITTLDRYEAVFERLEFELCNYYDLSAVYNMWIIREIEFFDIYLQIEKSKALKERYKELNKKSNSVIKQLFKTNLSAARKMKLCLFYVNPYWAYKICRYVAGRKSKE